MSFEIKPFEPSTSRRKGSTLKYLDTDRYEKTEITQSQYADIYRFNMAKDERYGSYCRAVDELNERIGINDADSKSSLLKLSEMRTLKAERERIRALINEGTASREDKEVFEKSKNFDKDFEALRKKDAAIQLTRESLRDKLDKASERLRDLSLKKLGITHIFKEQNRFFRESGGTSFLVQMDKEDEKLVGLEWCRFWLHHKELEKVNTPDVLPLLRRYHEAIDDRNPDKIAIKNVRDLLQDRPLVSRYEFYKKIMGTFNESLRRKFATKVNDIMDDDEKSDFLRHSMDPTKSMQQQVRERKTAEHRTKSLLKSAGEIWDDLTSAQKTAMGLTDAQVRKHQKGNAQKRGGNFQGGNQAKRNKTGSNKWGNGGNGNAKNNQNRHYNNDRHYSNEKGGNQNNKGGYKKPYVKHESKDYRPIPKKEDKKEYNN